MGPGQLSHDASSTRPSSIALRGRDLRLQDLARVARSRAGVELTGDPEVRARVDASHQFVREAAERGLPIYGVTTCFGGMSNVRVDPADVRELQRNALWMHKSGAGAPLPSESVRAALVLRANSLLRGSSGVRWELIERVVAFLEGGATPQVLEHGSIGASGDLVPLASMAGALIGLDPAFLVEMEGRWIPSTEALERLGLPPMELEPKEGLALINGTSASTGIAALALWDAQRYLGLALGAHALILQALGVGMESFDAFLHDEKPHPGQRWVAAEVRRVVEGSEYVAAGLATESGELIQDRYSLRCLPQYLGPVVDGMAAIQRQIEVEMNATTDNPLIDVERGRAIHGGNFLGQYVGMAMDQLRSLLGLTAKHLDAQLSLLVAPEFNRGLPASLVGNHARGVNMGVKGLQLCANALMPMLTFLGNTYVDRFATHAEQFNQNVNSLSFGAANLACQSAEVMRQYVSVALLMAVQGLDLRAFAMRGDYDPRPGLSSPSGGLYEAVRAAVGSPVRVDRPYLWNDDEQPLDAHIAAVAAASLDGGPLEAAVAETLHRLRTFDGR